MITTQKLSDLGFSIHDGMHKSEEKLTPNQLKYAQKWVIVWRDVHELDAWQK